MQFCKAPWPNLLPIQTAPSSMDRILDRLSTLETLWQLICPAKFEKDEEFDFSESKAPDLQRIFEAVDLAIQEALQDKRNLFLQLQELGFRIEEISRKSGISLTIPAIVSNRNFPVQLNALQSLLNELQQMNEWLRERIAKMRADCTVLLQEELQDDLQQHQVEALKVEGNYEPLPAWIIELLEENQNEAASGAICASLLDKFEEALEILQKRQDLHSTEYEELRNELQYLHQRLYPFEVLSAPEAIRISLLFSEESSSTEYAVALRAFPRPTLRKVVGEWRALERERSESISGAVLLIGRLWNLLETPDNHRFPLSAADVSLANLNLLQAERQRLVDFQQQRFRELYDAQLNELSKLMEALGWGATKQAALMASIPERFSYTAEGLQFLSRQLAILQPRLALTQVILKLITARSDLIAKMRDFEKSASDPARLFQSSFRLLEEERFRKNALPTLLNLEQQLRGNLDQYKTQFKEDFATNPLQDSETPVPYVLLLEEEVGSRFMSSGIFGFEQGKNRKERQSSPASLADSTPRYAKGSGAAVKIPTMARSTTVAAPSVQLSRKSSLKKS